MCCQHSPVHYSGEHSGTRLTVCSLGVHLWRRRMLHLQRSTASSFCFPALIWRWLIHRSLDQCSQFHSKASLTCSFNNAVLSVHADNSVLSSTISWKSNIQLFGYNFSLILPILCFYSSVHGGCFTAVSSVSRFICCEILM